jgi:hypothetical protein
LSAKAILKQGKNGRVGKFSQNLFLGGNSSMDLNQQRFGLCFFCLHRLTSIPDSDGITTEHQNLVSARMREAILAFLLMRNVSHQQKILSQGMQLC